MREMVPLAGVFFTKPAASAAMEVWLGSTYWPLALPSAA